MSPISKQPLICKCCKDARLNENKEPRQLVSVAVAGIKKPYWICGYCDGDALLAAKTLESARTRGN